MEFSPLVSEDELLIEEVITWELPCSYTTKLNGGSWINYTRDQKIRALINMLVFGRSGELTS